MLDLPQKPDEPQLDDQVLKVTFSSPTQQQSAFAPAVQKEFHYGESIQQGHLQVIGLQQILNVTFPGQA